MEKRSPRVSTKRFKLTSVSWRPTLAADGLPRTTLPQGKQGKVARDNYVVRDQSQGRNSVVRGLLLKIEDICAGYGKLEILYGVRLEVNSGELVCIIGPNGAGKSTAFKTVVGLVHPTSG